MVQHQNGAKGIFPVLDSSLGHGTWYLYEEIFCNSYLKKTNQLP